MKKSEQARAIGKAIAERALAKDISAAGLNSVVIALKEYDGLVIGVNTGAFRRLARQTMIDPTTAEA